MEKLNLSGETICNYYVDEKMKKVWETQLNILESVNKICEEADIKYFLAGGTALGAIRHHGYIPWDDDIDIMMKREDYLKFIEIAEKKLKPPYFMQYYKTEKKYNRGHMQIRNSETTAIIKDDLYNDFNKGIFIDIFPLDNVPDNLFIRTIFINKLRIKKILLNSYYNVSGCNKINTLIIKAISKIYWNIFDFQKSIEKYEKIIQKYNNKKTKQCGAIGFRPTEFKYENIWFENTIKLDFEYLKLNASPYIKEHLTRQYGDFMKIPENKRGSLHGEIFFDVEKSYKEYENNIEEILKQKGE